MLRRILGNSKRQLLRWRQRLNPVDLGILNQALLKLITAKPDVLFVHSSLSACGYISGGPAMVVTALSQLTNTLVLPTHSYCYPAVGQTIGPIYDHSRTESVVGAISNWFWQQPGVVRSLHPTHSVAAFGDHSDAICADHENCDTPCGSGTPYQTLIERRTSVLMFGCTMNTYTLFHTSEHFANCSYLYYPEPVSLRYRDREGRTRQMLMRRQNMYVPRRFADMDVELEAAGFLRSGTLRTGRILYIPNAHSVHNYLLKRMEATPSYLLQSA
jgi:aminoglycoside 3-N-acetyltransferase